MFTIMHDNLNICGIYMGQLLLFASVCMNKNVRLLIIQMQRPFNLYTDDTPFASTSSSSA